MIIDFDPVAFTVFGWGIHWYGLMYLLAFIGAWLLGRYRAKRPGSGWTVLQVDDLIFYAGVGVVIGGRVGYTLFYNLPVFLHDPLVMLRVWEGGMSFHGGLLGVLVALWLFKRRFDKRYFEVVDFFAPLVPFGLFTGRMGNFINGELWGKPTTLPWGMVFPNANDGGILRHPNPLYEAFLEGIVLFVILWLYSSKPRPMMAVSGLFAICYGVFRFAIEFVRVPDVQLGYLAGGWFTMGMLLSTPLIVAGIILMLLSRNK